MNQSPPDSEVEVIALELERYISLHPTAADTPGGIARWWLARPAQPALNLVETALDSLVDRGLLQRKTLPDGKILYLSAQRPPATRAPSH